MLENAANFFSIPLADLSLYDVIIVVLFVLALILTIIFSLILIASKLRRIDNDIKDNSNNQISNDKAILNYLDVISEQLSNKTASPVVQNSEIRNGTLDAPNAAQGNNDYRNNLSEEHLEKSENTAYAKKDAPNTLTANLPSTVVTPVDVNNSGLYLPQISISSLDNNNSVANQENKESNPELNEQAANYYATYNKPEIIEENKDTLANLRNKYSNLNNVEKYQNTAYQNTTLGNANTPLKNSIVETIKANLKNRGDAPLGKNNFNFKALKPSLNRNTTSALGNKFAKTAVFNKGNTKSLLSSKATDANRSQFNRKGLNAAANILGGATKGLLKDRTIGKPALRVSPLTAKSPLNRVTASTPAKTVAGRSPITTTSRTTPARTTTSVASRGTPARTLNATSRVSPLRTANATAKVTSTRSSIATTPSRTSSNTTRGVTTRATSALSARTTPARTTTNTSRTSSSNLRRDRTSTSSQRTANLRTSLPQRDRSLPATRRNTETRERQLSTR